MISISEREWRTLKSIEHGLARSAPKLASMLAIFTRLTAGERIPYRKPVRRAASRIAGPRDPGRGRRLQAGRAARRWLWLTVVLALLTLTVILSHGTGASPCQASRLGRYARRSQADRPPQAAQG
jgi:hypothetical protein